MKNSENKQNDGKRVYEPAQSPQHVKVSSGDKNFDSAIDKMLKKPFHLPSK